MTVKLATASLHEIILICHYLFYKYWVLFLWGELITLY